MQLSESILYRMIHSNIWTVTINGVDIYHIVSWFFIFSFFGWIWETALVSIRNKKYVNRGFVSGPVCTIYGAGAVSVYMILLPFSSSYPAIFFVGMIVATVLEYVTSAVMEKLFQARWWDYSNHRFNIKGRICLGVSIGWGFMSLALYLIFMPAANLIMGIFPVVAGEIILCVCVVLYAVDFSFAAVAAFNLSEKLHAMEASMAEMGEKIRSTKAYEAVSGALDELEERREILSYSETRKKMEEFRTQLIKREDRISQRFLKAYPKLSENMIFRKEEFERMKEEIRNKIDKMKKEG